jgi:hypothetical protein
MPVICSSMFVFYSIFLLENIFFLNYFFSEIMDIMYNNSINIRFGCVCVCENFGS